jgi:nucleotide-binding universal stress UspA family protein
MHVLIATTGVLTPGPVVDFTTRLLTSGGRVSVTTVIEVPRTFLEDLSSESWHPLENGDAPLWSEDDDALIARYVEERGRRLTEPVVSSLRAAGLTADAVYLEGEDPAKTISELADQLNVDVVILGATRQIFDQSAWESVSARVMIESGRPVLVVPPPHREPTPSEPEAVE